MALSVSELVSFAIPIIFMFLFSSKCMYMVCVLQHTHFLCYMLMYGVCTFQGESDGCINRLCSDSGILAG